MLRKTHLTAFQILLIQSSGSVLIHLSDRMEIIMKYMKKALAAVSALMICVSAAVPFAASAESLDSKVKTAIDEIVETMDKNQVITYISKAYDRVSVAYNGANGNYYSQVYAGTTIKCNDVEAVKAALAGYEVTEKDGALVVMLDPAKKEAAYNSLKALNTAEKTVVTSINEEYKVLRNGFNKIESVTVDTELTADVLSGKYGALDLVLDANASDGSVKKYVYKFAEPFGVNPTQAQIDSLRKLLQDNLYVDVKYEVTGTDTVKSEVISVLDYSDMLYGDVNEDGVVDLSDYTALSQFLLGDEVTISEAKADVAKNGKVDLADLATLRQYLMKDNVKLGVKVK